MGRQRLGKDVGNGVGDYAAVSPVCILALVLMCGKKLLKERRNVAVGKRIGYDGRRLGDDRGGCSNCEAPGRANNDAFERFIGVGVIDQIPRGTQKETSDCANERESRDERVLFR